MDIWMVRIVLTVETLVAGLFMLIIPKITRRGLLFGVYVGEEHWAGDRARAITRSWYIAMITALAGSVLLGIGLAFARPGSPIAVISPLILMLTGTVVCYLWAHFRSRTLATIGAPIAAAALVIESPQTLTAPIAATAIGIIGGAIAISYAWLHYAEMPARVPTHFGPSGLPDAWSARSLGSVMLLPVMTAFMCPLLGLLACLTARAKRAIRQADRGVSLDAQLRFRRAMTLFLSGIVVLVTLMLTSMSVASVRVALGLEAGLPAWSMAIMVVMVIYALGGTLYLMVHFGQGGARLERSAANAPLTNGLADNTHWVLGAIYVNRDDPSFLVEKRFGMGYTINLGNPRAIAFIVIFLALVFGAIVIARLMPPAHAPLP